MASKAVIVCNSSEAENLTFQLFAGAGKRMPCLNGQDSIGYEIECPKWPGRWMRIMKKRQEKVRKKFFS